MQLLDTEKAHVLTEKETYEKVEKRGRGSFNSQLEFCRLAVEAAGKQEEFVNNRVFIPETHHE